MIFVIIFNNYWQVGALLETVTLNVILHVMDSTPINELENILMFFSSSCFWAFRSSVSLITRISFRHFREESRRVDGCVHDMSWVVSCLIIMRYFSFFLIISRKIEFLVCVLWENYKLLLLCIHSQRAASSGQSPNNYFSYNSKQWMSSFLLYAKNKRRFHQKVNRCNGDDEEFLEVTH